MPKVICKTCVATGHSKCPHCRTVFPTNQIEAMLTWGLKFSHKENGAVEILFIGYPDQESQTNQQKVAEILHSLRNTLNLMAEQKDGYPSLEQYACNHKWDFAPGTKSEIDCGCGGSK